MKAKKLSKKTELSLYCIVAIEWLLITHLLSGEGVMYYIVTILATEITQLVAVTTRKLKGIRKVRCVVVLGIINILFLLSLMHII